MTEKKPAQLPAPRIEADLSLPPVTYHDVLEELGMAGDQVPFESLLDRPLRIERAKPLMSSYQEGAHAWFAVVTDMQSGERISTVVGGGACVEVLDAYAKAGRQEPLIVTPRRKDGGSFGRYYVFE